MARLDPPFAAISRRRIRLGVRAVTARRLHNGKGLHREITMQALLFRSVPSSGSAIVDHDLDPTVLRFGNTI
ncbi:MAG: hypothetical protein P1U72_20965, partial [Paracoccaceae bacterium]|nr:hypothetical protein [Paracoccaceae bacterium]